jgi:hypothetical protein
MTEPAGQPDPTPSTKEPAQGVPQHKLIPSHQEAAAGSAHDGAGTDAAADPNTRADPAPRWPFAAGSQNQTDKAVKLKPYVPPKRRGLNQY